MRVLVTGATGFLGGHLVESLRARGHETFATGRSAPASANFFPADLAEPGAAARFPARVDAVVHCAALSSPWGRPEDFERANVVATERILDYARGAGCGRVVHISSPSIYVDRHDRLDVREDDPLPELILNDYIRTKRRAERVVDAASRGGLSVITLRPQGIVGRGDRAIFPRILRAARRGIFPRVGTGVTMTDLTHVGNVVEAIHLALEVPARFGGRAYNVTNGEPIDLYGVIAEVLDRVGVRYRFKSLSLNRAFAIGGALEWTHRHFLNYREPALTRYTACTLGTSRTLNIDRARAELGYRPTFTLADAMNDLVTATGRV